MTIRAWFIQDPRTAQWSVCGNKTFLIFTILSYVITVKKLLPCFMRNRQPYDNLKPIIRLYNLAMVAANVWFTAKILSLTYFSGRYSWFCQGIDFTAQDPLTMETLSVMWTYLFIRIADFADTIFFVLRKKDSHVSLLHVGHHCLVVFSGWFTLTIGADGQLVLNLCMNSVIHIIMYTYYFFASFGPRFQKYLTWKRYLTQMQLAQFVIVMCHMHIPYIYNCGYPPEITIVLLPQFVFFFYMFIRFYKKAYLARKEHLKEAVPFTNGICHVKKIN